MQVVFRTYVRCISRAQNIQLPIKIEKKDNPTAHYLFIYLIDVYI